MPVNASPSSLTRAPKPASSPANRRPQGWRYSSVFFRHRHQARLRQSVLQRSAPIVSSHELRQQRRHYAAPASSDDAHDAPAHQRFRGLSQVTDPSDGLTSASLSTNRAMRFVFICSRRCRHLRRHQDAPPSLGLMAQLDGKSSTGRAIEANAACRGRKMERDSAQNGRGVPCSPQFPQCSGIRDGQKHLPEMNYTSDDDKTINKSNKGAPTKRSELMPPRTLFVLRCKAIAKPVLTTHQRNTSIAKPDTSHLTRCSDPRNLRT